MTARIDLYQVDFKFHTEGASLTPEVAPRKDGKRVPNAIPVTDHLGRATIPGPTVAGSLRDHIRRTAGAAAAQRLFGAEPGEATAPSAIRLLGVLPATSELVDDMSTAIDRRRGAAKSMTLRWTRQMQAGTAFTAYLRADDLDAADRELWQTSLETWAPLLGHAVSVGQGEVDVTSVKTGHLDLTQPQDLRRFLTTAGPGVFVGLPMTPLQVGTRTATRWAARFRLHSDLSTGSGEVEGNTTLIRKRGNLPLLTGRTLKGVFRSRVEFILRSVGLDACLDADCGQCLACRIFGWQGKDAGARSALRSLDAVVRNSNEERRDHVAIDRFTGGAQDGLLFSRQVARGGDVTIAFERLGGSDELWQTAEALLTLAAWDIHDGFVGLGGATTRGYGQLRLRASSQPDRAAAQQHLRARVEAGSKEGA